LTSFVGREQELEAVKNQLDRHRLVTLTGVGGCGKTRLAIRAAADLRNKYSDGVWLVEFAPLTDPVLVPQTVAKALGFKEEASRTVLQTLQSQLSGRTVLLVFDNCEHLVQACAETADALLRTASNVHILATSRESLRLVGEAIWLVPSLSLPEDGRGPSVDQARRSEAVQLFIDRAQVSKPTFALTAENAEAVAHICVRLDGIPLAIELAATLARMLPPQEILERLQDRLRLPAIGSRAKPPRQQTLRAAIDWSYELLSEAERALFCRLSVFTGGFEAPAAEQVCHGQPVVKDNLLELLFQLVDKSLIVADTEQEGSARYSMLEALRQYASEKLPAETLEPLRDAHLQHYVELARKAYAERLEEAETWLARLELEHDNLRAALEWSRERDPDRHLHLAGSLAWFWHFHSYLTEGRHILSQALLKDHKPSDQLARALWGAGTLAAWQGDTGTARALAERSLAMWSDVGNEREVALGLEALGWADVIEGRGEEAVHRFEESLQIQQRLGGPRSVNRALLAVCQALVS
jgi:non-specific serine/threonine protein kinase